MFWEGVAENVIAGLLTAAGLGSVAVGVAYRRLCPEVASDAPSAREQEARRRLWQGRHFSSGRCQRYGAATLATDSGPHEPFG